MYDIPKLKAFKRKFVQFYRKRPARLIAAGDTVKNSKKAG